MPSRLAIALLTLAIAAASSAADDPTQHVQLDPATNAATVTGTVTGYRSLRYIVSARGGKVLSTSFTPSKKSLYYNVVQGSHTLHDGSSEDNLDWSIVPAADGDYAIDVYFKSSDARRNAEATFILGITITNATVNYRCTDGRLVTVTYTSDPDPGAALVVVGGKSYELRRVVSDNGARYSANKVTWWKQSPEATLELDGPETQCRE